MEERSWGESPERLCGVSTACTPQCHPGRGLYGGAIETTERPTPSPPADALVKMAKLQGSEPGSDVSSRSAWAGYLNAGLSHL